jgi:hypothetical protein
MKAPCFRMFWSLLFSLFLAAPICLGQRQQRMDSIVLANGLNGLGTASVKDSSGIKIFNGTFSFKHNERDTSDDNAVRAIIYGGKYDSGRKNGAWLFEIDHLFPQGDAVVEDLRLVRTAAGQRSVVRANFKNGQADNYWTVHKTKVAHSVDVDSSFYAKAFFTKNNMRGAFMVWSDSLSITGQIDEMGYLDGEWVFRHQTKEGAFVNEYRVYKAGRLLEHSIALEGKEIEIPHIGMDDNFGDEQEEWVDLYIEKPYLSILQESLVYKKENLDASLRSALQMSVKASEFFQNALHSFRLAGDLEIWNIQKNDLSIEMPKVKVRRYGYADEEKEKINKALDLLAKSKTLTREILDNPQVEINRHSIKEVAQYYAILKIFNEEINKLTRVFMTLDSPTFEYLNRDKIVPHLIEELSFPKQLNYTFNDSLLRAAFIFPDNLSKNEMHVLGLYELASRIYASVQKCHEEVNPIVQRNKTKAQLTQLEEKLIQNRDSVHNLFNNKLKRDDFAELHLKYQKSVISKVDQIFVAYGKQDLNLRLESINETIAQLEDLIAFYSTLIEINTEMKDITERYIRVVWNPYTYTDMEETVKERLYLAYKNYLLTYLFNTLDQSISTGDMAQKKIDFNTLFEKMKSLREVDTKDLERALKRQTNPKTIANLLELNFDF